MLPATLLAWCVLSGGPWSPLDVRAVGYVWSTDNRQPCLYQPQEGDIILTTSKDKVYAILWWLAGTGHPYHSAMVVRRSNGRLELFENGGGDSHSATLRALPERLTDLFQDYGDRQPAAWVRRRRVPLTAEQSARLTAFAESQLGKRFSPRNEFLSLIPTRGRVYRSGDPGQPTWICSEMIFAGIEQAGLMPPGAISNPGRLSPRDILMDRKVDMSAFWYPPQRWTADTTPPGQYRGYPTP